MLNKSVNVVIVGGGSTWSPGILKALTKHLDIFKINELKLLTKNVKKKLGNLVKSFLEKKHQKLSSHTQLIQKLHLKM